MVSDRASEPRLGQCSGMSPEAGGFPIASSAYCAGVGRRQRGLVSLSFYLVFLTGFAAVGFYLQVPASNTHLEVSPRSTGVYYVDACISSGGDRVCGSSSRLTYAEAERLARQACANGIKDACTIGSRSTIGSGGYTISNRP